MEVSNLFVCLMGMGVTFIGLICLILLITLMGKIVGGGTAAKTAEPSAAPAAPAAPASLSPAVHQILRDTLGFDGVILTDDLAMEAVAQYAQDGSAAVLAVQAGNDMVLTTDFETQIPQVIAAVEDGTIPMEQIDQSVARVLSWKYDLGLLGY